MYTEDLPTDMDASHVRDWKFLSSDRAQQANDIMRQHWNRVVALEFNLPNGYQSVAVLLIHWADWLDNGLKCRDETTSLETVFREKFGFVTQRVVLDCRHKKPQTQLHLAMSQFISDYDGPHRTTLLIIYYSGHGVTRVENGVEQFHITGNMQAGSNEIASLHEPTCRWNIVDTHLQDANADVLMIVDSSYAATNYYNDSRQRTAGAGAIDGRMERSFEILAATHDLTYAPGPRSFTRALIRSLLDLHGGTVGDTQRPFDTSRLHGQILHHIRSISPRGHIPPLFNRDIDFNVRHICLAPLSNNSSQALPPTDRASGILHLQVVFAKNRELQKGETTRLAQLLAQAAKSADLKITSLDWVKFESTEPGTQITIATILHLKNWVRNWRARRSERSHPRSRYPKELDDSKPAKRLRVSSPAGPRTPLTSPPSSAAARDATTDSIDAMVRQHFSEGGGIINCTVAWELASCVETDLGGVPTLDTFLTITGHASSAYATTCSEWIHHIWGDLGMSVLHATCEALVHGTFTSEHLEFRMNDQSVAAGYADVVVRHLNVDEAVIVVQTLAWLAATFRPPKDDSLSSSSATVSLDGGRMCISLQALVKVEADPLTSCWQSLLGNSVIAGGFYISDGGNGLELPLPLMLELTGMLYGTALSESAFSNSISYTGIHSILYPTERNDALGILKWHYAASDCVMTPPVDHAWPQVCRADLDDMRIILGYTPNVKVNPGTENRSQQYVSMTTSHAQREKDSWAFAWDGFTAQAGFAGSSISLPFKFSRRRGQQGVPTANPTYDQIIHGTVDKPVILYETARAQEIAWLVPQLSVILDLVHLQAYRERSWKDLSASDRSALHAKPDWNSGLAALKVLDDYQRANTALGTSAGDGKPIAIKDLVTQVFAAMSYRMQLDQLHPAPSSLTTSPLLGWDLIQLTDALAIPTRLQMEVHKYRSNNSPPTWLPLARELPVFFCDGLGDVMTSTVPTCSQFQRSQKYLVASIHVLRSKLRKCFKCDDYHIDTKKQLVWQLPRSGCFPPCPHGVHCKEDARANFDAGVQLMLPAGDNKCFKRKLPCPVIPEEGAVVFGAKRLRRGRSSFE